MAFTNLVKKMNEKSIVACMRDGKAHTKQELARLTGLSFPTAGKIVEELADGGMLLRLGTARESPGGRKAEVYRLNPDFAHILLLFIQENTVYYRICDAMGAVREEGRKTREVEQQNMEWQKGPRSTERRQETEQRKEETQNAELQRKERSWPGMDELMLECVKKAVETDRKIFAVSAGIPGSVHDGTICCIDGYPGLEGRNIAAELAAAVGKPAAAGNNMSLVALGMAEIQGRKSGETLVCIHLADTGPGMGAVVNGKALQGFSGFQGEVGFMPLYGDENVQKIAMDGFDKVSPGECLGKMAACICTVLNPERVICYLEREQSGLAEDIVHSCQKYLPAYAVPRFVFDRNYREDYFHGLAVTGMELIYGKE